MFWSNQHDIMLCRNVLLVEPYNHKFGSRERGNAWDVIVTELNNLQQPKFTVTKRAVRDRYNLLLTNFKQEERERERASGINVEETEIDTLLFEIMDKSKEAARIHDDESENKKKSMEKEKESAAEQRQRAMETFAESRKRNSEGSSNESKKQRRTSSDTLSYLREKSEQEFELRERELKVREEENKMMKHMFQAVLEKLTK